ncbi:MAG: DUF3352 domain-containing protein [Bacteroidetes bacterium]|nr:DUF3352 domain-containing protein [Bacteroidota bacterium]
MLKKIGIAILIVILLIVAFVIYKLLSRHSNEISPSINAVPIDAAIIVETHDFHRLLTDLQNKSKIWNELTVTETGKRINDQITWLDSAISKNGDISSMCRQPVIISVHTTGKEKIDFLYLLNLPQGFSEEQVYDVLSGLIGNTGIISERIYNDVPVYDIKPVVKGKTGSCSYSVTKGIVIFSFSSLLVEEAIRQLTTNSSLGKDAGFIKVQSTAGKNVDANIYLNYTNLPRPLSVFLNENYRESITGSSEFADWTELDVNMKENAILLNGFTLASDSLAGYLSIFKNQSPQKIRIEEFLPDNTATFVALGISDFQTFDRDYKSFLEKTGRLDRHKAVLNDLEAKYNINLKETFLPLLEKEIALVYTDDNNKDIDQSTYVVFRTKSRSEAEEKLKGLLMKIGEKDGKTLEQYTSDTKIDNETSFPIFTMPVKYVAGKLFGSLFSRAETGYFTFIDNCLVFGNSQKSLSKYIHNIILQRKLMADVNYTQFSENLSAKSNYYLYSNVACSPGLLATYVNDELRSDIEEHIGIVHKFQGLAIQFSAENNMIYNNIYVLFNPVFRQKPHTVWESRLDTCVATKPKLVVNHNTQEKEIFVQDMENTIYLINSAGRILWKIPLGQKIISDIYQIDFYKNNKLQLLFSTRDKIHLLDRNGNYVERYPVNLRSPATNGIALFDYEENKDYRIFVACRDKKIYAYTADGNIITGWEFDKTETYVRNELQHIRVDDKDFIVFADSLKFYILDRRGNERIKPEKYFPGSANNLFFLENKTKKNDPRLVTTDTSGAVCYIYLDGKVECTGTGKYTSAHFFDYKDMNSDNYKDMIYCDKNKVEVFSRDMKLIFSHEFDNTIKAPPVFYLFPDNEGKLGIPDITDNEIYLYNSNGSVYEGFPLEGSTQFSIGHMSPGTVKFNLIVGSKDGFLYNYEVH